MKRFSSFKLAALVTAACVLIGSGAALAENECLTYKNSSNFRVSNGTDELGRPRWRACGPRSRELLVFGHQALDSR